MPRTLAKCKTFCRGMREFRAHYDDYDLLLAYDGGREWAHRLTFRRYDR